jgi:hypothetical protein
MLCKIWVFQGSDFEECRLLGYKNSVRTSQETHYVFATGPSRLMLCRIWGFHGGNYEECRLLGCYALWLFKNRRFGGLSASIIRVRRTCELGTLAVTSNRRKLVTLIMEALSSTETSVLTRTTRRNIPEDAILDIIAVSSWVTIFPDTFTSARLDFVRRIVLLFI